MLRRQFLSRPTNAGRVPLPRAAAAALLLSLGTGGSTAEGQASAPLAPVAGVVRPGPTAGHLTLDGVTKPLAAVDAPFEVRLAERWPAVLHVAAALVPPQAADVRGAAVCEVRRADGAPGRPLASLTLDHWRKGWAEAEIVLASPHSNVLRFECRPDGAAMPRTVWARPVLRRLAAEPEGAPLVVVMSLDTLRADHVWGFGAPVNRTPALGQLGDEGMRFVETTSEGTWTLPSHFALLFSRLYGFPIGEHRLISLAQALGDHGYATAGFTAGGFVAAAFGFNEGFDHYVEFDAAYAHGGSDVLMLPDLLDAVDEWIDRFATTPLFLFLHTYAVHQQTLDEIEWFARYDALAPLEAGPVRIAEARRLYRRLVRRTDRAVSRLFARLRRESATRPVVAVVLSDHGEAFGEHDNFRHGDNASSVTLHDEVVRVPLIVWGPGIVASGAVARRPTMLMDVGPSLLAGAGIPIPPSMVGASLWPMWNARTAADGSVPVVPDGGSLTRGGRGWALRSASRKLILEPDSVEFYDLRRDPGERRNVAHRYPRAVAAFRQRLAARVARLGESPLAIGEQMPECPLCTSDDMATFFQLVGAAQHRGLVEIVVDEQTRERLRALGYLDF